MENLYLINGDDEIAKAEALEKIKSKFNRLEKGINYLQFDKDNLSFFENELNTYSLFAEDKLLVVKAPSTKKKNADEEEDTQNTNDWFNDDLKDKILNKIESITVVFIENGKLRSKLFNFVDKNGEVITCEQMKPLQVEKWLVGELKERGYDISSINVEHLVSMCGNNKMIIANEIEKLINYVDGNEIKFEDINSLCIRTPEVIIFELTDNMGEKNAQKALFVLDELLNNKEPIQKVMIMLARHFKNLLITKECINQGKNVMDVLELKLPFQAKKYMTQARNFTFNELVSIFKDFVKLDMDSKISLIDAKIGLQKILLR